MTLQSVPGGVAIPNVIRGSAASPTLSTDAVNSTTAKQASIFRVPKSGNVHKIGFNLAAVTTAGAPNIQLQTVDATTGLPTGTGYAASSATNFTPAAGWNEVTLGADVAVTAGDEIAIVIAANGGASSFTVNMLTDTIWSGGYPFCARFSAGSWAKRAKRPVMALIYDDATCGQVLDNFPITSITAATFNSGSTPDERALKFVAKWPMRVAGVWVFADGDGDFSVKLYDTDGTTVLGTITTDKDIREGTNEDTYFLRFTTPITLVVNSTYRLSILPTSATNMTMYEFVFPSAAAMDACELGQNWSQSQRTDAGAWTDNTLTRPIGVGLMIDKFDDGLSGAGETSLGYAG